MAELYPNDVTYFAIAVRDQNTGEPRIDLRGASGYFVPRGTAPANAAASAVPLIDLNRLPLTQPLTISPNGYYPTFTDPAGISNDGVIRRLDFISGDNVQPIDSLEGVERSAAVSRMVAEGAEQAALEIKALAESGAFDGAAGGPGPAGPQGLPGVNAIPAAEAVAAYLNDEDGPARQVLNATYVTGEAVGAGFNRRSDQWFSTRDPRFGISGDGTTDDSDAINSAMASVQAQGGGTLYFPDLKYIADGLQKRTRVNMVGRNMRGTTIQARAGSTNPFCLGLRPGEVESSDIRDINLLGNGNLGQNGFQAIGAKAPGGFSGGWWNSKAENFRVSGFLGHQIYLQSSPAGASVPHQFLTFINVKAFSQPGYNALRIEGQVGQIEYVQCQFENQGLTVATDQASAPIFIGAGGYVHNFRGCTIQDALWAVIIEQASPVTFDECYWENTGRNLTVRSASKSVSVKGGSWSNGGADGSGTGYGVRAEGASVVGIGDVKVNGNIDVLYSADVGSIVYQSGGPLRQVSLVERTMSGNTKQHGVDSAGAISLLTGQSVAFVNTGATVLTTITSRAMGGDVLHLKANGAGTLSISNAGNIDLGSRGAGPLVIKGGDWVTLIRQDLSGRAWQVTAVSPGSAQTA